MTEYNGDEEGAKNVFPKRKVALKALETLRYYFLFNFKKKWKEKTKKKLKIYDKATSIPNYFVRK